MPGLQASKVNKRSVKPVRVFHLLAARVHAYCIPEIHGFAREYVWAALTLLHCGMAQCQPCLGKHMSTFQSWVKSAVTQKNRGEQKRFSKNGNEA